LIKFTTINENVPFAAKRLRRTARHSVSRSAHASHFIVSYNTTCAVLVGPVAVIRCSATDSISEKKGRTTIGKLIAANRVARLTAFFPVFWATIREDAVGTAGVVGTAEGRRTTAGIKSIIATSTRFTNHRTTVRPVWATHVIKTDITICIIACLRTARAPGTCLPARLPGEEQIKGSDGCHSEDQL
jgi:hypothetical protein